MLKASTSNFGKFVGPLAEFLNPGKGWASEIHDKQLALHLKAGANQSSYILTKYVCVLEWNINIKSISKDRWILQKSK